jgi:hypothetical protein
MSKKLLSLVAGASTLFLATGFTAAHAASPAFCGDYARAAINQVRGGLSLPGCAGRLEGPRWSSDFRVHYGWCLGVTFAAAGAERDARTNFLRACRGI